MFQDHVQKRLNLIDCGQDKKVDCSDALFHLTEKGEGQADLEVCLSHPCIIFKDLEKRKLDYFKNNKCADYVVFENRVQGWVVHIFELKRTVKPKEWSHIKLQFAGALQNALALAGVLNIDFVLEQVELYTVYRNDLINDMANPGRLRYQMHEKTSGSMISDSDDWNKQFIILDFLEDIELSHHKIKLDVEQGTGKISLC